MKSNSSVQEKAQVVIKPIVESLGYVLVDITYKKELNGMTLWICIDKEDGIDINDCERVSKALDEPLDNNDITNGASYNLNITSYGLDRAFKTDYDFNKHLHQDIIVKFYKPWNGKKEIIANLESFDKDNIVIKFNDEQFTISKKDTALIQKFIKF